jgi:hypothetical protein
VVLRQDLLLSRLFLEPLPTEAAQAREHVDVSRLLRGECESAHVQKSEGFLLRQKEYLLWQSGR